MIAIAARAKNDRGHQHGVCMADAILVFLMGKNVRLLSGEDLDGRLRA